MPPLPAVPSTLRIVPEWTIGEDITVKARWFNTYTGGLPDSTDLNTFAGTVLASLDTRFKSALSTANALTGVTVTDLSAPTAGEGVAVGNHVGTNSSGALPAGAAALFNFTVARRYRGGKPRIYFPYGCENDMLNATVWSAAFISGLTTAWGQLQSDIVGQVVGAATISTQHNVSYYEGFTSVQNPITHRWRNVPTLRPGGPLLDAITSVSLNPKPGSQRRRYQR